MDNTMENAWDRMKVLKFMQDEKMVASIDEAQEFFVTALKTLEEAKVNFDALIKNTSDRVKDYREATGRMDINKINNLFNSFEQDKKNLKRSFDTTINGFVVVDEGVSEKTISDVSEKNFNIQKVR